VTTQPIPPQCEAICDCGGSRDGRDQQCPAPALFQFGGRFVCYVHKTAALNPNRLGAVRFIVRATDNTSGAL
jgi:hypothetical protein